MTGRLKKDKLKRMCQELPRDPICLERARLIKITKSSVRRVTESTVTFRCVHLWFQPSYIVYPTKTSVISSILPIPSGRFEVLIERYMKITFFCDVTPFSRAAYTDQTASHPRTV
jgi:hypothetical protein